MYVMKMPNKCQNFGHLICNICIVIRKVPNWYIYIYIYCIYRIQWRLHASSGSVQLNKYFACHIYVRTCNLEKVKTLCSVGIWIVYNWQICKHMNQTASELTPCAYRLCTFSALFFVLPSLWNMYEKSIFCFAEQERWCTSASPKNRELMIIIIPK